MTPTSISRDIKLGLATGEYQLTIDTNKLPKWGYFFIKKRRIIKDLFNRGLILTGSRALNCFKINGKELLNRNPNDWDFIATEQQFLTLCKDYKIYDFDLTKSGYLLNKSFATFSDGYGNDSHLFPCIIQIIVKDETTHTKKDGIRFASLEEIISSKLSMINNYDSKHQKDINNIIVNICG